MTVSGVCDCKWCVWCEFEWFVYVWCMCECAPVCFDWMSGMLVYNYGD